MEFSIREADRDDELILVEMLYEALFVPPGSPPFPRSITDRPDLARYARGFGSKDGDLGWIAESLLGDLLGAAWVRQMSADDPGYGFVDAEDTRALDCRRLRSQIAGCGYRPSRASPGGGAAMQPLS